MASATAAALALGEAREPADDRVGILPLEIAGDARQLPQGALALPVLDWRIVDGLGARHLVSGVRHL